MKALTVFISLLGVASAMVDFSKWHPPVPSDARSPCPVLNSLANHGILPRNGKGLSVPMLVDSLNSALNVSKEVATTLAHAGLRTSSDPKSGKFNLNDLKKHDVIEHDASLSRKDFYLGGEDQAFCPEIFDEFIGYFDGAADITIPLVAKARWGRVQTERGRNPKFSYGPGAQFNSYAESSVYYLLLKDPKTGAVPVDFIVILFSQERLPWAEGWRPITLIDGFTFANTALQLALNTPEKAPGVKHDSMALHGLKLQ